MEKTMTAPKRHVYGTIDLAAAASREGQIYSERRRLRPRPFLVAAILLVSLTAAPMPVSRHAAGPGVATAVTVSDAPIANFEVIRNGELSISRMPANASEWQSLMAMGVNSIVTLDDSMVDVAQYGFASFLWVRPGLGGVPSSEGAGRFLTFIQQADNQPIHVVSMNRRRLGTMVALLRYAVEAWKIEDALADGNRVEGGAGLKPHQVAWLRSWAQSHPPGSTATSVGSPLPGFEVVWRGQLSASRTPEDASQWQSLLAFGANSIVNLDNRRLDVAQYGFASFLWVRPGAGGIAAYEDADRFLTFIQQADNQPVHMVSAARPRRAIMVALIRYAIDAWTIEDALAEGQSLLGDARFTPHQVAWLRGWAESYASGSHCASVQLPPPSTPSAPPPPADPTLSQ
jgi:hypothetical protein